MRFSTTWYIICTILPALAVTRSASSSSSFFSSSSSLLLPPPPPPSSSPSSFFSCSSCSSYLSHRFLRASSAVASSTFHLPATHGPLKAVPRPPLPPLPPLPRIPQFPFLSFPLRFPSLLHHSHTVPPLLHPSLFPLPSSTLPSFLPVDVHLPVPLSTSSPLPRSVSIPLSSLS